MKIKQYQNSDGSVTYGYSVVAKKWQFIVPAINFTLLCGVPSRAEGARKIANILLGSVKRCGGLDNLARKNISKYAV